MRGQERYQPKSDFLRSVIAEEIPFEAGKFGEHNLQRLIEFTTDEDVSNRDWATFLLSGLVRIDGMYRDDIKAALIKSASDAEPAVRGEAICGLVSLDRPLALSLAQRELKAACVSAMIFEAAEELADDSLVEDLVHFQDRSDNSLVDGLAADALRACRGLPNERNIE